MPDYSQETIKNDDEVYDFLFQPRGIPHAIQYKTKVFSKDIKDVNIQVYRHTWKQGDKLYKLAAKYYRTFKHWWVIALANKISSEADLDYGDQIVIPIRAEDIINNI
jgi:nucleoid-associated protein YgaU